MEKLLYDREDELFDCKNEISELEEKLLSETVPKVTMMLNENDRLSETLDQRNNEIKDWKRKYDEVESEKSRKISELDSEVFRLKSDLNRIENALQQRENRLAELEDTMNNLDRKTKDLHEDLYDEKRHNEDLQNKLNVLEPEL